MGGLSRLFWIAVLACAAPAAAQQARPPVEAYGRLPLTGDVSLSPDGTRVAQVIASGDQSGIRVLNVDTGATVRALSAPDRTKVRGVSWADDDHVIYVTSESLRSTDTLRPGVWTGGRNVLEYWRSSILTVSNGRTRYVEFDDDDNWRHGSTAGIVAPIAGDPGTGRMVSFSLEGQLTVFRVNLEGGEPRPAVTTGAETVDIALTERGTVGARIDNDQRTNRWRMFFYVDGTPRQIAEGVAEVGGAPSLQGFLPDGRLVVSSGEREGERQRLYTVNASGEEQPLTDSQTNDVGGVITDPWTHAVVGSGWTEDLPVRRYFDPAVQAVNDRLQQRFETGYAVIESWSRDKSRYLVFAETAEDAGAYYIYEPANDRLRIVGQTYPDLRGLPALGNRQTITYRARDGTRIPAYLTTPAEGEARNLPAVLLVHGGPHARDTFAFD